MQMCMDLSGGSNVDFVYYTFNGLVIIGVNFGKQHLQKLIVKLNSFYKDCVVPQVPKNKNKNIEIIFFATNHFMFSSKKVNKYNILYVNYHTKDHIFLSHNGLILS